MNMNPNALLDQIEIKIYSIITSCLNGINIFQGHENHQVKYPQHTSETDEESFYPVISDIRKKILKTNWTYLNQYLTSIFIWVILGFATGFLIGMIKPR
jgi:hypothetical protein